MARLVGEHRLADDIADRKNVRLVGPHLPVDRNKTVLIHSYDCRLRADHRTVRFAPDCDEDTTVNLRVRRTIAGKTNLEPLVERLGSAYRDAEHDLLVLFSNPFFQRPDQVGIAPRHQPAGHFHDRNSNAKRLVDGRQFQSYDPAADDQHPRRQLLQLERAGRIHDPLVVGQKWQPGRFRTRGNDALLELDDLRLSGVSGSAHLQVVRRQEFTLSFDDANLAFFCQPVQTAGQLPDDLVFPSAQSLRVDNRFGKGDAELGHGFCVVHDLGDMQQRFRRDTADVEANSAERVPALHQRRLQTKIGRPKRGCVPARPGPQYQQAGRDIDFSGVIRSRHRRFAPATTTAPSACRDRRAQWPGSW